MFLVKCCLKKSSTPLLLFLLIHASFFVNAQSVIDSLEICAKKAKPGWDQIDMAIGLGRLYSNASYFDKAQYHVNTIYKWAKENNIPSAKSYALTIEGTIADTSLDDADKAITFYNEAIKVAKETNNKDALTYASTELSKILIWNKGNTKKGMALLFALLENIDESVSKKNEGVLHYSLAHAYLLIGDYIKSLTHYKNALSCFQGIIDNPVIDPKINRVSAQLAKPNKHIGFVLNDIGNLYLKKGNTAKALSYKKKALATILKTNTVTHIAWMHVNLSKIYVALGDYSTALDYIGKARKMYETRNLSADIAWVDSIMTSLFFSLKDYEMAAVYCKKNLDYLEKFNPKSSYYGRTFLRMVEIQFDKEDYVLAEYYLKKATSKINKTDNSGNKALLNRLKGEMAFKKEKVNEAKILFKKAIKFNKILGLEPEIAICEYKLATVFFYEKKTDSSFVYVNNSLKKSKKIKDTDLAKKGYALLTNLYASNGNYKKAFKTQEVLIRYNDSLFTNNAMGMLKTEQVRQDVLNFKNEKELAEQNASLLAERNKLYTIWGIVLICVLVMMFYVYANLRKEKAKTQAQNIELTELNNVKDKFFGIIAHDLRSPLLGLQNVGKQISYFIRKEKPEKLIELSGHIEDSSKKLTELLDNLLDWALLQKGMNPYHPEEISLKQSVDNVVSLLKPIATTKQITLTNNVAENCFVYADSKAVNTILRNIVSNALKFTDKDGVVKINVQNKENQAIITISDTGVGISAVQISKLFELNKKSVNGTLGETGSGLGLVLCKELIALNKGTIKVVSNLGKGTIFMVNLPKYSKALS